MSAAERYRNEVHSSSRFTFSLANGRLIIDANDGEHLDCYSRAEAIVLIDYLAELIRNVEYARPDGCLAPDWAIRMGLHSDSARTQDARCLDPEANPWCGCYWGQ